ncbi:hypothetical protein A0H81_13662 [Grifola frondosa]|uniref:3'-5' exonuclease domain-containing protein n=1 Tax=Grifola frondosa TaxID=5627 RepID=A0A1C7LP89_GRIFR|nr:hypothetical protein A0H81_13662 [Grifola frondosa]
MAPSPTRYTYCMTYASAADAMAILSRSAYLILDCEGRTIGCVGGALSILAIGTANASEIFLFDVVALADKNHSSLAPLLQLLRSEEIPKIVWDGRSDALELLLTYDVVLGGVLDLQLAEVISRAAVRGGGRRRLKWLATSYFRKIAAEVHANPSMFDDIHTVIGLDKCLQQCSVAVGQTKDPAVVALHASKGSEVWMERPLQPRLLQYAAHDIQLIGLLYAHFLRVGWIRRGRAAHALLREQSTRYIRVWTSRDQKTLINDLGLGVFVPMDTFTALSEDKEKHDCVSCKRELTQTCFTVRKATGKLQRKRCCRLCEVTARNKRRPIDESWVEIMTE